MDLCSVVSEIAVFVMKYMMLQICQLNNFGNMRINLSFDPQYKDVFRNIPTFHMRVLMLHPKSSRKYQLLHYMKPS